MKINETKNKLPKYITIADSLYNWQCIVLPSSFNNGNSITILLKNISHGLFQ